MRSPEIVLVLAVAVLLVGLGLWALSRARRAGRLRRPPTPSPMLPLFGRTTQSSQERLYRESLASIPDRESVPQAPV